MTSLICDIKPQVIQGVETALEEADSMLGSDTYH